MTGGHQEVGGPAPGGERIAIVIPALNEVDNLGRLLDDCAAQRPSPDEVVVVDAGSRDGTPDLVRARAEGWPALTLLEAPGATPGQGRNEGIHAARAELIATVDAGTRLRPGWLEALTQPVREAGTARERRAAVGVAESDARTAFERAAGWLTLQAFKPTGGRTPVGELVPAGRSGYCFSRSAWRVAGGYPDELPWGEDKLFLKRLQSAGVEVFPAPNAVVQWRPRTSLGALYRQYERYGRGDAMAGLDRRNELVTLGLYGTGALLALLGLRGSRAAGVGLAVAAPAYLGLFLAAAGRDLGRDRALAWVPVIRLTVDIAKMSGFLGGVLTAAPGMDGRTSRRLRAKGSPQHSRDRDWRVTGAGIRE